MNLTTLERKIKEQINQSNGRISLMLEIEDQTIEINSKDQYASASLIKIPILMAGFKKVENGGLYLNQLIKVTSEEKVGGAGVIQALSEGLSFTLKDLLTLMIIISDNTATNVLIDLIGENEINSYTQKIGLYCTELNRKMMDFIAIEQGKNNYTCAHDMVTCLKKINEESSFLTESTNEMLFILKSQQLMDKLPALMDLDKVVVANKTGELPGVEHDCAIITYQGRNVYTAVLVDGLSNKEEGRQVIAKIGKLIYDYLIN